MTMAQEPQQPQTMSDINKRLEPPLSHSVVAFCWYNELKAPV
jgi:hypothetical protein